MPSRPRIHLFCEDRGHEQFVRALVGRLALEAKLTPIVFSPSARGGHARALEEFRLWQQSYGSGQETSDLLVLVIDSNCTNWNQARQQLLQAIDGSSIPRSVVGCPDPHVERWYIADPPTFERVVGVAPKSDPGKCERDLYKRLIGEAAAAAAVPILTGPADLAPDLVRSMDLFRAGKNQPSLRHFVDELKGAISLLASLPAAGS